jgi:hypothetical protein
MAHQGDLGGRIPEFTGADKLDKFLDNGRVDRSLRDISREAAEMVSDD